MATIVGPLELDRTVHAWLGVRNIRIILGSDERDVSLTVEYFDHNVLVICKQLEDAFRVEEMVTGGGNVSQFVLEEEHSHIYGQIGGNSDEIGAFDVFEIDDVGVVCLS